MEQRLRADEEKQARAELAAEIFAAKQALQNEAVLAHKIQSKLNACKLQCGADTYHEQKCVHLT